MLCRLQWFQACAVLQNHIGEGKNSLSRQDALVKRVLFHPFNQCVRGCHFWIKQCMFGMQSHQVNTVKYVKVCGAVLNRHHVLRISSGQKIWRFGQLRLLNVVKVALLKEVLQTQTFHPKDHHDLLVKSIFALPVFLRIFCIVNRQFKLSFFLMSVLRNRYSNFIQICYGRDVQNKRA